MRFCEIQAINKQNIYVSNLYHTKAREYALLYGSNR